MTTIKVLTVKSIRAVLLCCAIIFPIILSGCSGANETSFLQKGKHGSTGKLVYRPPEESIIEDADTRLEIIKDVINMTFKPGTDEATVEKIIASANGKIVGYDKAVNFYQIRFPGADLATVDSIRIKLLSEFKEVELTSLAFISVHKNPFYVK